MKKGKNALFLAVSVLMTTTTLIDGAVILVDNANSYAESRGLTPSRVTRPRKGYLPRVRIEEMRPDLRVLSTSRRKCKDSNCYTGSSCFNTGAPFCSALIEDGRRNTKCRVHQARGTADTSKNHSFDCRNENTESNVNGSTGET